MSARPLVGVTGATGFIGGALVARLAERGDYDLVVVDDGSGPVHVPPLITSRLLEAYQGDFAGSEALRALAECDAIVHLAAVSGVVPCAREPERTARVNVEGTRRLYEVCRERRIPVAFASSLAVVGRVGRFPAREATPARPTHEYARQKAEGERLTRALSSSSAEEAGGSVVRTAILRQSNVYGGYRAPADAAWVAKANVLEVFARQASDDGGRLTVNAPGTQRRDFVHIEDVVAHWEAALRYLLLAPEPSSGEPASRTFNVASGESYSVAEVAEEVRAAYALAHPGRRALRVEVVPNPREGIEVVEPTFRVERAVTSALLGVECRHRLRDEVPAILARAEAQQQEQGVPA